MAEAAEAEQSGSLSELFRRLFVNRAAGAKGVDPDDSVGSVNVIDDAEAPNTVLPVAV